MEGKRLIHEITLKNFLSYGSEMEPFELQALNVLIGPNASGKSNLIAAMSLLQAAPNDLLDPIRQGGGAAEWIWKGAGGDPQAEIQVVVERPAEAGPLWYRLGFRSVNQRFAIEDEEVAALAPANTAPRSILAYRYNQGQPDVALASGHARFLPGTLSGNQSVLSQLLSVFPGGKAVPPLYHLRGAFSGIRIYREWDVGEGSHLRNPQPADLDEAFLYESGQNLPSVINDLDNRPRALEPLVARLQRFYEAVERLTTRASANTLLLMIQERGLKEAIPATRLSDGTLRYLCLLAILCHPEPPPLICIEEPELGLHPDVLHSVAELLVEASQRTQLIVTTHSDLLVSALSEVPEAVVVCERTDEGTELRRLEPDKLKDWLERYSLGELWTMGELGGNP